MCVCVLVLMEVGCLLKGWATNYHCRGFVTLEFARQSKIWTGICLLVDVCVRTKWLVIMFFAVFFPFTVIVIFSNPETKRLNVCFCL